MPGTTLHRIGASAMFVTTTVGIFIATSAASSAASDAGAPSPILIGIAVTGFIAWVIFSFAPMMRKARLHAQMDRENEIECDMRMGMSDYLTTQKVAEKIKNKG